MLVESKQLLYEEEIEPSLPLRLTNERVTTPEEAILTRDRLQQRSNEKVTTISETVPARDTAKLIKKCHG